MSSVLETLKAADAAIRKQRPLPIIGGPRLAAFMEKNLGYLIIEKLRRTNDSNKN